jgi:hypothetical protein
MESYDDASQDGNHKLSAFQLFLISWKMGWKGVEQAAVLLWR